MLSRYVAFCVRIFHSSHSSDKRSPTHHIDTIHTQYLRRICTFSNLEGLRYVGGPLLDPCTQCGKTNVIRYVYYFEGEDRPSESECPNCLEGYDINQLLSSQVCSSKEYRHCGCINHALFIMVHEYLFIVCMQAKHQGSVHDTHTMAALKTGLLVISN